MRDRHIAIITAFVVFAALGFMLLQLKACVECVHADGDPIQGAFGIICLEKE